MNNLTVTNLPDGGEIRSYLDGAVEYRNAAGLLHREDGPALIWSDGSEHWYLNGQFNREDGPAIVYPDGSEEWYLSDVLIVSLFEGVVYLGGKHLIPPDLVEDVMYQKGIGTEEEFCTWLAIDVLGQEAVNLVQREGVKCGVIASGVEGFLANLDEFDGLPFSWWYPIVEGAVNQ